MSFLIALALPAFSQAKIRFSPTLTLQEDWSDNIDQAPDGEEEASFITSVSPAISLSDKTANSDYRLNYLYQYHHYSNSGFDDRDENTLNAALNHFQFDRSLRFFVNGGIFNSRVQPGVFSDGITGTEQVETRTAAAGIQYDSGLRAWHTTSFGTEYRKTMTDDDLADTGVHSVEFSTGNGRKTQKLNWRLGGTGSYDSEKNEHHSIQGHVGIQVAGNYSIFTLGQYSYTAPDGDNTRNFEFSSWGAGIRRDTPKSSFGVSLNKEETGGDEKFVGVDFSWSPSVRTTLSGAYSHRFFGKSYEFQLSHKTRRMTNTISYRDSVTSFSQQSASSGLGFLVCPAGNSYNQADCFVPTDPGAPLEDNQQLVGVNTPFLKISENQVLVRSLSHLTRYTKSKTTLTLSTHWNRTKSLSSGSIDDKNYDRDFGGIASWGWKIGSRTEFQMSGGWNKFEKDINLASEESVKEVFSRLNLTRQFSPKVTTSLSYTFTKHESSIAENSFNENRAGVSATARF